MMKEEKMRHSTRYTCELCGKIYVVPSLARDCENADLDNPERLSPALRDKLSHETGAGTA